MIDETDGPQAGTEGNDTFVQPSTVETPAAEPSEDTAEQKIGTDDADATDDTVSEPPKEKRKPWWDVKIDKITAKRYEAEREAAYWRGIAEASKQPSQPAPLGPPTEEECGWDQAEYQRRSAQYYREEGRKAAREELQSYTAEQQQQAQLQTATQRLNEGATKHADFMDVVHDIPVTEAVRDLLVNEPNASDILYEAGKDPGEARRIFSLSPYLQAVELGKIAARLETPKPAAPRNIPPPPPQTVSGMSAGLAKAPQDMSMAEYMHWYGTRDKT